MSAWRCSECGTNWPFQGEFSKQCTCGGDVWCANEAQAISVDEARRLRTQAKTDIEAAKARLEKRRESHEKFADWDVARAMANFDEEWASLNAPRRPAAN